MATAATTYTFAPSTTILSAEANTNFTDLVDFLNQEVVHKDGSVAFTAHASGPATDPTTANQYSRKSYVDAKDLLRAKDGTAAAYSQNPTTSTSLSLVGTMTHGTHQLLVQGGSDVDVPSVGGGVAVAFPTAFPAGVLSVVVSNGDTDAAAAAIIGVDQDTVTLSGFTARWYRDDGTLITSGSRRTNWIALGW